MTLTAISIKNYRSVRDIHFPIKKLTVFCGKNGVGKTNLYRALQLLHFAAQGTITRAIAEEGGVQSVMWAGPRKKHHKARIVLSAELNNLIYRIEIGLPRPTDAALDLEPMIKEEELILQQGTRRLTLMKRVGPSVVMRDDKGKMYPQEIALLPSETALASFRGGADHPELEQVRAELDDWRFYHDFRSDRDSPVRRPSTALCTPTLSSDGCDLAAVFATVFDIQQDPVDIMEAVDDAFGGTRLRTSINSGLTSFSMSYPTDFPDADPPIDRPYNALELSDGTLRYLCLVGALLGYRLPGFIALNEPESSLHPDLIGPLARLIKRAAERTNVWIVTHSEQLAVQLSEETGIIPRTVIKEGGVTWLKGLRKTGTFSDDDYEEYR